MSHLSEHFVFFYAEGVVFKLIVVLTSFSKLIKIMLLVAFLFGNGSHYTFPWIFETFVARYVNRFLWRDLNPIHGRIWVQ